jgi:hypothetical protein
MEKNKVLFSLSSAIIFLASVNFLAALDDDKEIKDLIKDLSASEYSVRKVAKEKLINIGQKAIPYLEESAKSDDVELSENSKEIISAIRGKGKDECAKAEGECRVLTEDEKSFILEDPWGELEVPGAIEDDEDKNETISAKIVTSKDGEEITLESSDKGFILTVKPEDGEIQKYSAKDRKEFLREFPDIYKQYKDVIDSLKFTVSRPRAVPFKFKVHNFNKEFNRSLEKSLKDLFEELNESPWHNKDEWEWGFDYDKQLESLKDALKNFTFGFDDEDGFFTRPRAHPSEQEDEEQELDEDFSRKSSTEKRIKPNLGIELAVLSEEDAEARGLGDDVIVISRIDKECELYKHGLREGDAILSVSDKESENTVQIRRDLVRVLAEGGTIVIDRDGEKKTIEVKQ